MKKPKHFSIILLDPSRASNRNDMIIIINMIKWIIGVVMWEVKHIVVI